MHSQIGSPTSMTSYHSDLIAISDWANSDFLRLFHLSSDCRLENRWYPSGMKSRKQLSLALETRNEWNKAHYQRAFLWSNCRKYCLLINLSWYYTVLCTVFLNLFFDRIFFLRLIQLSPWIDKYFLSMLSLNWDYWACHFCHTSCYITLALTSWQSQQTKVTVQWGCSLHARWIVPPQNLFSNVEMTVRYYLSQKEILTSRSPHHVETDT